MAQECGFFNAELVGDEFDRVYLAEQFAAYFASFIGNGVFGKSMQQLKVVANDEPDMAVQVLSGEAWINGWWYRNTDAYTLSLSIADGVMSRIDAIVLRWGRSERDMWLDVITGEPSTERPTVPSLRRDADYYDLRLAYVTVNAGSVSITQSQITDTRLDNSVCGLVTGVVNQIDTTDLYNQFQSYFEEFKQKHEVEFDDWVADREDSYDSWIGQKMLEWMEWFNQFKDFIESLENGELLLRVEALFNEIFGLATNADIDAIIDGIYIDVPESNVVVETATDDDIDAILDGEYMETEEEDIYLFPGVE